MNKKGYTLAEVLITLGVIGVISAVTLPPIIQNYQKQATASRLKKAYNNLNNAMQMAVNDNGDMNTWDFSEAGYIVENSVFYKTYIKPYFKILKVITKNNQGYDRNTKTIDGKSMLTPTNWYILSDGTIISMYNNFSSFSHYFWIFVDINGAKSPNRLGKDIFMLELDEKKNRIKFWNQGQTNNQLKSNTGGGYQCTKGTNGNHAGGNCGAKIMQDGWKISDDYPW